MMWFLANEEVSFIDSLGITGVCVLIVFLMLILLALVVAAFQLFNKKAPAQEVVEDGAPVQYAQPSTLKFEEIKEDVRVVSIKQIG